MTIVRNVLRFAIALILLATGIGKAIDLEGFAEVISTYDVLPPSLLMPAGATMVVTELGLAVWLAVGFQRRRAAVAAAALHLLFIGWISVALLRGLDIPNCGCFGVFFGRPLTGWTIVEDLVMVVAALIVFTGAAQDRSSPLRLELRT